MTLSLAAVPEGVVTVKQVCPVCEKEFEKNRPHQKYCSVACKKKRYWLAHREQWRVSFRKYRETHKEVEVKRSSAYKRANVGAIAKTRHTYNLTIKAKLDLYKNNAKNQGRTFCLTDEEFAAFWQKPCAYCGSEIQTIGLDRLDNDKGYTINNVAPCCKYCNYGKRTRTPEEYIEHCHKVSAMNPIKQIAAA